MNIVFYDHHFFFAGATFGSVLAMFGSGWLINHAGWKSVFYAGFLGVCLWFPVWMIMIRDTPENHTCIGREELTILDRRRNVKNQVCVMNLSYI